jgi:hypothetical protein
MQRKRPRIIKIKMMPPRTPPTMAAVGALWPSRGVCVASLAEDVGIPADGAWLLTLVVADIVDNGVVAAVEGSTVTVEYIVVGAVLDSPDSDSSESESTVDECDDLLQHRRYSLELGVLSWLFGHPDTDPHGSTKQHPA